jgi:predicted nucleotidyltransferase
MITKKKISKIVSSIVAQCAPEKVIFFGSHAYGKPTNDSDIDLFVVANIRGIASERIRTVRRAVPDQVAVEIVVRTPEEVERSLKGRDWFVKEVFQEGKVLYAC